MTADPAAESTRTRRLLTWLGPLLYCAGFSAFVFRDALLMGRAFFYRDVLHLFWPQHHALNLSLQAFELPQWNPGWYGGVPLVVSCSSQR